MVEGPALVGYESFLAEYDQRLAEETDRGHAVCILRLNLLKAAVDTLQYCEDRNVKIELTAFDVAESFVTSMHEFLEGCTFNG